MRCPGELPTVSVRPQLQCEAALWAWERLMLPNRVPAVGNAREDAGYERV
jgi:hypothetical protein